MSKFHTSNLSIFRMWWTITGNFGNILPIDWSKSYSRQLHTKSLKLGEKRVSKLRLFQVGKAANQLEVWIPGWVLKNLSSISLLGRMQSHLTNVHAERLVASVSKAWFTQNIEHELSALMSFAHIWSFFVCTLPAPWQLAHWRLRGLFGKTTICSYEASCVN